MARKSRSRAPRTPASNQASLKPSFCLECRPFSHIDKFHCEDGNKIIMPPSALDVLMSMKNIKYPMTFKIINPFLEKYSHCGVLEFSGDEGYVFLPNWMMNNLLLQQGQLVNLEYTELSKGQSLKIQPHKTEFVKNLSDPKEVMEKIFKDFTCVTTGDTIMVNHENQSYYIDIVETRPDKAVSLFETDCELEFETPLDYKEPEKITPKVEQLKAATNLEKDVIFKPFTGVSRRLDGQVTAPPVAAAVDDNKLVADSRKRKHARNAGCGLDDISSAAKTKKAKTEETEDVKGKTKENTEEKIKPKVEQVEEVKDTINLEKNAVFKPFTGVSRRLDGQVSAPPPVAAPAVDDKKLVADSRRHARIVGCGLDGISSAAKEKAKTEETEDVKGKTKKNTEEKTFQPFTGKKYTLSSCC
ncbi:ubiquitin fusion degradation protein 1-like [Heracleum sosnowskyi]|uniref:Ubiquitin fusion degradation protein 1-like n=1 Tax=Heracleum sosnowskyi TaxID=360622 RepID=A0AAD8HJX5_9APIA|nr:ubiquitin fusion degradation protein 1-like [Heracleum sosnowskyi]